MRVVCAHVLQCQILAGSNEVVELRIILRVTKAGHDDEGDVCADVQVKEGQAEHINGRTLCLA
jgi:hypothetical protein